jgi:large subunit ribosomal protein L16
MLSPKRTKYRKYHRGRMRGKATRGNEICFGDFGLQALEPTWITSRQIEAARRTITRYTKRGASLWIRIFPDKTVTARAAESRMGSGKGAVDYWVAVVKPGTILFEISSVPEEVARAALNLAAYKLPLKTKYLLLKTILNNIWVYLNLLILSPFQI